MTAPGPGYDRFQCRNFHNCGQLVRIANTYCDRCTVCVPFSLLSIAALDRASSEAYHYISRSRATEVFKVINILVLALRLWESVWHWPSTLYLPAFEISAPNSIITHAATAVATWCGLPTPCVTGAWYVLVPCSFERSHTQKL